MKISVFIIVIVIQAVICEKAVSKLQRKLIVPKMNEECKKIKCASVEDPVCVRMRRHDLSLTVHVIAANKCELEYMKCHDDVEAKIVPMKYCSHNVALKKKTETGKAHIRVKRKTAQRQGASQELKTTKVISVTTTQPNKKPQAPQLKTGLKGKDPKTKLSASKKHRLYNKKLRLQMKKMKNWNEMSKNNEQSRNTLKEESGNNVQHVRQSFGIGFSTEFDTDEDNERKRLSKGISGHEAVINDDVLTLRPSLLEVKKALYPTSDSDYAFGGKTPPDMLQMNAQLEEEEEPDFPMISKESNFSLGLAEADKGEYDEICPTVCPVRDVMVCGKCQHGIYRTFNSVCHLRMFSCQHDDEVLVLISRSPCVFSAPYLSEMDMIPQGRMMEKNDDDKILRFILCRDKGLLGKVGGDPRCTFPKQKENLKFYDFKGVQINMGHHIVENSASESKDTAY